MADVRHDGEGAVRAAELWSALTNLALQIASAGGDRTRDEVRARVIPAYMGLIKQIDDQLGVLFRFLDERGLSANTMIVFTSDHGDYLGDHWLGEKDFFHDCTVKVPLIVADPSPDASTNHFAVNLCPLSV